MTLPTTGSISLTDVMNEIRIANPSRAYPISLGDTDVLALAGKVAPPISISDLYGKSSYVAMSGTLADLAMTGAANAGTPYTEHAAISISLSGGLAPFSYAWSHVSGSGSIDATNSATTTVNMPVARFGSIGDEKSQVVQCIVTDAKSNTLTRQCTVTMVLE